MKRRKIKKTTSKKKRPYGFSIEYDSFVHSGHDGEDSNDRFRYRGTTHTDWTIHGVKWTNVYPDLPAYFEPVVDETYYLLYGVYSIGDSFGYDVDGAFEAIAVFKDHDAALKAKNVLKEHAERAKQDDSSVAKFQCDITLDGTTCISVHVPWTGYFERLSYLEIFPFTFKEQGLMMKSPE